MPLGPPEDPDRFEDTDECVAALSDDPDLSESDAEDICGAWEQATSDQAMTDHDDAQHRSYYQPDPDDVELREDDDDADGTFTVRMPLASTGEVRNEGDEPLTRDELDGMARQIDERSIGVFLDHGSNPDIAGSRYSAVEKVGEWRASEMHERDADDDAELVADAVMMDPTTLPDESGPIREALTSIREQVKRDMTLSSSIGWRDDESFPGDVDLMEASIVGIPADPRTTSQGAGAAVAMARSVLDDADVPADERERLVDQFRAVVMGSEADEQRHLSDQQAERAVQVLDAYRDEQGNGSVQNFESWLWGPARGRFDDEQVHAAMTALEEFYRETTPLDEPVTNAFAPFLDDRQDGDTDTNHMTDDSTDSGDDAGDDRDGSDGMDAQEYREFMREQQEQQTEILRTLADALREDDDDDDDDDDDGGDSDGDDKDDDDDDDDRSADDLAAEVADLREQLEEARQNGDVDTPDADETQDADDADEQRDTDDEPPDDPSLSLLGGS